MNVKDFTAGSYRKAAGYRYFLPAKINHSFVWTDGSVNELLETALLKLGELQAFSRLVPDVSAFIIMHVAKEAVLSSKIEGTQTTMEDVFMEGGGAQPENRDDWKEVSNYMKAMNAAIEELDRLPLSQRLIKKAHAMLLDSGRGAKKTPGEYRRSQNWIGGASLKDAVFIPPVHTELPELMTDLEFFLHNNEIKVPHLIKIAIAHYQFEAIHPFLDGNGRIGRLLITLYLAANRILDQPLLYLSAFIEKHREAYYDSLTRVRTHNDLTQWIRFFLVGVAQTAERSAAALQKVIKLKTSSEQLMASLGKRSRSGMVLLHALFEKPLISIKDAQKSTGLSYRAARQLVGLFVEQGILKEMTGRRRSRIFSFHRYMACFAEENE